MSQKSELCYTFRWLLTENFFPGITAVKIPNYTFRPGIQDFFCHGPAPEAMLVRFPIILEKLGRYMVKITGKDFLAAREAGMLFLGLTPQ
jgi:hypothetical protein